MAANGSVPLYILNTSREQDEDEEAILYAYVSLQSVLTLVILLGNGFVLYAIIRHIRLKRTPTFILITNLVAADLFMGLSLPVQALSRLGVFPLPVDYCCFIRLAVMTLASFASLFSVLLTAVDRYLGVCRITHYSTIASPNRVTLAVVVVWIYSAVFAIYPIHYFTIDSAIVIKAGECMYRDSLSKVYALFIPLQYFAILFLMCFLYFKIHRVAMRRRRLISCDSFTCTRGVKIQQELKTAKLMAVIITVFVFCWTPFGIYQVYEAFASSVNPTVARLGNASVFLGIINSAVNPLIYPLQNKVFRRTFKRMLKIR